MSNMDDFSIVKEIEIDHTHIDNFVMETNEGTKRTKEKFYNEAVNNRNDYVQRQRSIFNQYKIECENEMIQRVKQLMPEDKSSLYEKGIKEVEQLLNLVKLNSNISNGFKLGIDFIIASITDDTSLENLNDILKQFIDRFQEFGIILSIEDFKYTMFTEKYMNSFFANSSLDVMKDIFEKIYFACPDIKMQIKMNLHDIVKKYHDKLDKYVICLRDKQFTEYQVTSQNVIEKYVVVRYQSGNEIAVDPYYNTILFTEGHKKITDYLEEAPARAKNYNSFALNEDYGALSDDEKNHFNSAMMGFYLTLNELKKFYRYEFILKDLLERNKDKASAKGQFASKKKEIDKEEKKRLSIYKDYMKANGVGFLAKKNDAKMKDAMLKMNEHIRNLNTLYEEYRDLEITNNLNQLNDSASIYDLFMMSLTSFDFLEKKFKKDEVLAEESLEKNMEEYFRFIYNPNNNFLRKINVFADYDIVSVVADKYRLLNLNVDSEMIDPDNIDATMDTVSFINLIQNIERSPITLHEISVLCQMKEILSKTDNNSSEVI